MIQNNISKSPATPPSFSPPLVPLREWLLQDVYNVDSQLVTVVPR